MRVLLDLEQRLQSWEVTLKDCQLPTLTQEDLAMVQQIDANLNLPSAIREELHFDFHSMAALARFSSFCCFPTDCILIFVEHVFNNQSNAVTGSPR